MIAEHLLQGYRLTEQLTYSATYEYAEQKPDWQERTARLYSDGGVFRPRRCEAGSWAWVAVDADGWMVNYEFGWVTVLNNQTDGALCIMCGYENMPNMQQTRGRSSLRNSTRQGADALQGMHERLHDRVEGQKPGVQEEAGSSAAQEAPSATPGSSDRSERIQGTSVRLLRSSGLEVSDHRPYQRRRQRSQGESGHGIWSGEFLQVAEEEQLSARISGALPQLQSGEVHVRDLSSCVRCGEPLGVSNNNSEYLAMLRAVESMPADWGGKVCSDSGITIGRFSQGWKHLNIPLQWERRMQEATARLSLNPEDYILHKGHPTRADIAAGEGRRKPGGRLYPVSVHQELCDKLCGLALQLWSTHSGVTR